MRKWLSFLRKPLNRFVNYTFSIYVTLNHGMLTIVTIPSRNDGSREDTFKSTFEQRTPTITLPLNASTKPRSQLRLKVNQALIRTLPDFNGCLVLVRLLTGETVK